MKKSNTLCVNPLLNEPYLKKQLKIFQINSTNSIMDIAQGQKNRLNKILYEGLSSGTSAKEIAKELENLEGIGKKRAILIARDQTNKFHGKLAELRQTELGIEEYKWTTAHDERVRHSHKARDGKIYRWDNPPDGGHPGSESECRCIAQPIIKSNLF